MPLDIPNFVKNFLNANEKTENNFVTALLLDKSLFPKEKELLLFIFHLVNRSDDLKITVDEVATFTLVDLEKLGIAYRATASKILQKLVKDKIIGWNKNDHTFQINYRWIEETLHKHQGNKLEYFYKLLLKQN